MAGVFRTIYLQRAVDPLTLDTTWETFNAFVAGAAEAEIALIYPCAPSLNHLFGRVFRGASVSSRRSNDSGPENKRNWNIGAMQSEPRSELAVKHDGDAEKTNMRFQSQSLFYDQITGGSDNGLDHAVPNSGFAVGSHERRQFTGAV